MTEGVKKEIEEQQVFRPGTDEPAEVEGHVWRRVRGLDPTKNPKTISGWRLEKLPDKKVNEPSASSYPKGVAPPDEDFELPMGGVPSGDKD